MPSGVPPPWTYDAGCAFGLALASTVWIKVCNALATSGTISKANSRKLVHIGSGPGFVLIWPFFSRLPSAQIAAITVPILSLAKLYAAGRAPAGSERGAELVAAISRTGDRSEALGGPFLYTIVLLLASLFGFRSVASIVAICQMAVGDGMADLVGRRFGSVKWPLPFARQKSLVGTAAFAGFAWLACLGMVGLYHARGFTALTMASAAPALLAVSVACALIELLPIGDDNLTVPAAAAVLSVLFGLR